MAGLEKMFSALIVETVHTELTNTHALITVIMEDAMTSEYVFSKSSESWR